MTEEPAFLSVLRPEEAEALRAQSIRRHYQRGSTLFREGDKSDRVLVVISGRVKVFSLTMEGREIVLAVRGPGDVLGELSAIDDQPRSATATAVEPVEALVLPSEAFVEWLQCTPRVALLLVRLVSGRLRDADRKRAEYGSHDSTGRVARRLLELSQQHGVAEGDGIRITLPLSQEELAGWTGSSREAVSKALRTLREEGLIDTQRRSITVRDPEELRRFAE